MESEGAGGIGRGQKSRNPRDSLKQPIEEARLERLEGGMLG